MTNKDLANLIFPNITKTIEDYKKIYPERKNILATQTCDKLCRLAPTTLIPIILTRG